MKQATFAPAYCAIYPKLAELAREHGYALAVHGSLQRDFDLVCIPWVEQPSPPEVVVASMVNGYDMRTVGEREMKLHGRIVYTIGMHNFGNATAWIDLSFMPLEAAS